MKLLRRIQGIFSRLRYSGLPRCRAGSCAASVKYIDTPPLLTSDGSGRGHAAPLC